MVFSEHGKLGYQQGILSNIRENLQQTIFVRHSNICVKLFWTSSEQSRALLTWSERGGDLFVGVYIE